MDVSESCAPAPLEERSAKKLAGAQGCSLRLRLKNRKAIIGQIDGRMVPVCGSEPQTTRDPVSIPGGGTVRRALVAGENREI